MRAATSPGVTHSCASRLSALRTALAAEGTLFRAVLRRTAGSPTVWASPSRHWHRQWQAATPPTRQLTTLCGQRLSSSRRTGGNFKFNKLSLSVGAGVAAGLWGGMAHWARRLPVGHWRALQRSVAKPLHVQVAVSASNGALNSAVRGGLQHPTEANNAVTATVAVFWRRKTTGRRRLISLSLSIHAHASAATGMPR